MAFVRRAAELEEVVDMVAAVLGSEDSLWIVWPRRAAGHDSDVTENLLREACCPPGSWT